MEYEHYVPNESPPVILNLLRTWGEVGVVKTRTKTTTKLADIGVTCMMVVYYVNLGGVLPNNRKYTTYWWTNLSGH